MAYEQRITPATHVGEHGDHPLGGALGSVVGAAVGVAGAGAIQGAALGTVAGPVGMAAGAVVGGIAGALVGKGVAQLVNPTTEDEYWERTHTLRPYVDKSVGYDRYGPAYRHGIDAYTRHRGVEFSDAEAQISREWEETTRATPSSLPWDKAQPAIRDAYDRLHAAHVRDAKKFEDA